MCDFCRKESRTERRTEIGGISACVVKVIPLPAINLTTGKAEETAKEPFYQIRFYDEDMEVDVIAICCECTEYSDYATCDIDDMIGDYGYIYTKEEYLSDNDITSEEFNQEDYIIELITRIEHRTTVLKLKNGGYIIFSF